MRNHFDKISNSYNKTEGDSRSINGKRYGDRTGEMRSSHKMLIKPESTSCDEGSKYTQNNPKWVNHDFVFNIANYQSLAQFIMQTRNRIADGLNKLRKSTSSNVYGEGDKYSTNKSHDNSVSN